MNFNAFVSNIIRESINKPILDGKREIYTIRIINDGLPPAITQMYRIQDANQIKVYDYLTADYNHPSYRVLYVGDSYHDAVKFFRWGLQNINSVELLYKLQEVDDETGRFCDNADIKGTYKVYNIFDEWAVITFEVDTQYYYNQPIQDTPFKDFDF